MVKIRASVIGCGRMGAFTSSEVKKYAPKCWFPLSHLEAIKENKDTIVEAICDKSQEAILNVKKKYKIKNCYRDYKELINQHKNEIICIATRTNEKLNIVKYAKEKGVNYFHIEKPLCNSTSDLINFKKFSKSGLKITYGAIRRYMKPYIDAKKLINSKKLGNLRHIDINFGSGQLYWAHPHSVDLLLFFTNDEMPKNLQAFFKKVEIKKSKGNFIVKNDPYLESALFIFRDNITGNINNYGNCDVEIHCENGTILVEGDGARLVIKKKIRNHPYNYKTKTIQYDDYYPQGTFKPLKILSELIKNKTSSYNMNHIFIGQQILFALIASHINHSKLINPAKMKKNIEILGLTNNKYA